VAFNVGWFWVLVAFDGGTRDDTVEMVLSVEVGVEMEFERVEGVDENFRGFWNAELRLWLRKDVSNTWVKVAKEIRDRLPRNKRQKFFRSFQDICKPCQLGCGNLVDADRDKHASSIFNPRLHHL
jgi:hypothetical protein